MIRDIDRLEPISAEDAAAEWVVIMSAPVVSAHVERQFDLWIRADPDHARLYADLLATWHSEALPPALETQGRVDRRRIWSRQLGLIAGGAIAAGLVIGLVGAKVPLPFAPESAVYTTAIATGGGEFQDVALPDGSHIALSGHSAVTVRFDKDRREVRLERGEAYFDVARDKNRPFIARAATTQVKVIGTAFNIDLPDAKRVEVSVYRGKVEVAAGGQSNALTAGQKWIGRDGGLSIVRFEAVTAPDWQGGWYEAEDVALERLISEVNRFSTQPITVPDAVLASKPVSGRFKVSDPALVLSGLEQVYGLKVRRDKTVIVLTK